ncbi:mandelate racemase/muconate lactonizing enzyme family protein [Pararhizobium mangrovi]|uniref:Mandelate racemase/muconate lactonizing enzyme family protein n=2 Tax=Pararhizobium mangrovi TaxID=2590452 RepID=A0A506UFB3_9HYPH|nr:mandelate racemase/muconate lactonizing enzyme family protein [Pararhizobium mangrovi]
MIRIACIEPYVYRFPIETPVVTSFGVMRDRPALFVRVVDADGAEGWGESWCNFPSVGAEHRARLIRETLAPLIVDRSWEEPADVYDMLVRSTEVLAIQSGEDGPIAQAIAGIDLAVWDLSARRAGEPLYRHLGAVGAADVPLYASGLNADGWEDVATKRYAEGYRRFKLKVGFGREKDISNLRTLRATFGAQTPLMIDANQAWDRETALAMAEACAEFAPVWLEEPMRADVPAPVWTDLSRWSPVPLAAGENVRGKRDFDVAIRAMGLAYLQPDIGKWGGITANREICREAVEAGLVYCPHWLGGGIGLAASFHLLAAIGGGGALEVDANPNPLREAIFSQLGPIRDGALSPGDTPGIGVRPPLRDLEPYRIELPPC